MRPRQRAWLRRFRRRHSAPGTGEMSDANGSALDALSAAIDLDRLTAGEFIQLLETLHMLSEADAGVALHSMSTDSLVDLIAKASKKQLKALSEHPVLRGFVLEEIFQRMADHLVVEKVEDLMVVVTWRFPNAASGGYDIFQTVIEDGACLSAADLGRTPDTTVTLTVYDFLRMATGTAAVAPMFVRGKIKVKGDYALAATFSSYFDIPKPS